MQKWHWPDIYHFLITIECAYSMAYAICINMVWCPIIVWIGRHEQKVQLNGINVADVSSTHSQLNWVKLIIETKPEKLIDLVHRYIYNII